MSQPDVKQIVAQEYIKCAKDPAYFMKKYCFIQHPTRGRILFNLYPFQEGVLHLFRDNQYIITLKSRQLGISTLASAYALWLMLFHKDKNVLALATTQATARNLVTKTIFMYENLPKWLQLPFTEKNKLSLRLKNGSKITAKSSNSDSARSEAVSLLLVDEAAFIDNIEDTFTAAQQTLATGGQCIALSTPNGVGNWFHKTWEKAEAAENSFVPVKLPWSVHPERDQSWRDQQDQDLGVKNAAQECDCLWGNSLIGIKDATTEETKQISLEDLYNKIQEPEYLLKSTRITCKKNTKYEVKTPTGFKSFSGIRKTTKSRVVQITLSNLTYLEVSENHRFIVEGKEILAKNLIENQEISPGIFIKTILTTKKDSLLYDLTDVADGSLYLTDGIVSHNCDFMSSGDTVIEVENMAFYEQTYVVDPAERRGVDGNLWIWESVDYTKSYAVVADVARGDSTDYSTFHIIDIDNASQVGEYKGKLSPKEFGNVLVGIASEYNDALLVVENANIGWATIEQIVSREYKNLYYSSRSDTETVESYMVKYERDKLVPGFTMSLKTRPLVVAKLTEYVRERSVLIRSKRLLSEMRVFIWKNGKAQAQVGYNDDLVMAFAIALYVRDTAIRMRQQGLDLSRAQISSFVSSNQRATPAVYGVGSSQQNPYLLRTQYGQEDISWLL